MNGNEMTAIGIQGIGRLKRIKGNLKKGLRGYEFEKMIQRKLVQIVPNIIQEICK